MDSHNITEMLKALKPAIRSQKKAQEILERYWSDRIAIIWTTRDVYRAANEWETVLTEDEAIQVLQDLHQHHNPQLGLRWEDLSCCIKNAGLGRTITKRELHRFVHRDILAIRRK